MKSEEKINCPRSRPGIATENSSKLTLKFRFNFLLSSERNLLLENMMEWKWEMRLLLIEAAKEKRIHRADDETLFIFYFLPRLLPLDMIDSNWELFSVAVDVYECLS